MVSDSVSLTFSLTSTASVRTRMAMAKSIDKMLFEVVWPVSDAHLLHMNMAVNETRTAHTADDGRQLCTVQSPS